ncbi:VOC family protein [Mycobacterium talmoniae]|uniref:Glyoxalase n=1 Tax=Mycobacterium talmoniae TaxID=1858794 RepID=A0A1S1NGM1_9MYCO|nr:MULTISPECIES: VOC family protein [Mycobacterium]OHV04879.1 glyoxalase [Mycobacterium talmoniae]TDH53905.1 glyoxalase [Mycobacterium eburneum]
MSEPTAQGNAPTAPRAAALPYLAVTDARRALDWYTDTFGGTVVGEPIVMDDGRVGHAELAIGDGVLYLADEYPEFGLRAPSADAISVSLMLPVPDTDTVLQRAQDRGAQVLREAYDNYGNRNATIADPFGHRWMLVGPIPEAAATIQHGDIGYVSVWTPDADRAAAFYGQVLGWTYDPDSHQVTNTDLPTGIFAAGELATLFCCYAVADLDAARHAIAEAGGKPGQTYDFDHGAVLNATDPQGGPFAVYQSSGEQKRPTRNGSRPGELSYVTYHVPDSAGFRDFYGRVLGWTFAPGNVDDGWQIAPVHPMAGVAGGSPQPLTVPMWTVADIGAAVAVVRAAGGTVLQGPVRQPYGLTAECLDDQGGRFYLGER